MKTLTKFTLSILLIATLACALVACTSPLDAETEQVASEVVPPKEMTGLNWMSFLNNDVWVSDISIPGTHNSGSYNSVGLNYFGQTQSLTLTEQLEAGVRTFDLRLIWAESGFKFYHGVLDVNLTLDEITAYFEEFLSANPTECLFAIIKQEDDENEESFVTDINTYLTEHHIYHTGTTIPTLGEVRGKVVLLRRYESDTKIGINLRSSEEEDWNHWGYETFTLDGITAHCQDNYSLRGEENARSKWQNFLDLYTEDISSHELIFNYTSAYYNKALGKFDIPDVRACAADVNAIFAKEFPNLSPRNFGMIMMDFITEDYAKLIYKTNFN